MRGLEKINSLDEEIVEGLGFQLPQELMSSQAPRICKLLGNEGGETQEPQHMEMELEAVETFMHIRMTEEEWNSTSARYGADHYNRGDGCEVEVHQSSGWRPELCDP